MSAEEKHETSSAGAAELSGGGGSKLPVILSLVNTLATLGMVAVLFLAHQKEKSQPTMQDIVAGEAKGGHGEAKKDGGGHGDAAKKAEGGGGGHGEAKSDGHGGGGGHGAAGGGNAEAVDAGKIIPLEAFTVNLTTGTGTHPRYVRMNVSMELEEGVPDKEFDVKLPRVRDTIINLLNSKRANEIAVVEERERLKEEIKRAVNGFMSQSKVKGVYFTNFAVSN